MAARKPPVRHATVVAYLALFVALGGTAYATVGLARNSVKSIHIAPGEVKAADLGANAVTSAKVKDGSLLTADFKAGQLPAGPQGPEGPAGPQGPAGSISGVAAGGDLAGTYPNPTLRAGAVSSASVTDNALALADLVGADTSLAMNISIGPRRCTDMAVAVIGAKAGEVPLVSLQPGSFLPTPITLAALNVPADNQVTVRICNAEDATVGFNPTIRVITFG